MAVTDFETKVAVVVRDDLAVWQRLNVCAFLISGVAAHAGDEAIGEPYEDADGSAYLPLLVQPVVVLEGDACAAAAQPRARRAARRADRRVHAGDVRDRRRRGQPGRRQGSSQAPSSTWWASPCARRTATPTR